MRIGVLISEIWRNVLTGTTRLGLWTMAFTVAVGVPVAFEFLSIAQLTAESNEYRSSGANVMTVQSEGLVSGSACVALGQLPGVASVALRHEQDPINVTSLTTTPLEHYVVAGDVREVFFVQLVGEGRAGLFLSEEVVRTLGLQRELATSEGQLPVAGVFPYPDDGRRGGFGFAALEEEAVSATGYDECWIAMWPEREDAASLVRSTLRGSGDQHGAQPIVGQLNMSHGAHFDGHDRFMGRLSRFAPCLSALMGAALGCLASSRRRLEFASLRHCGARQHELLTWQLLESGTWILCGVVLAALASSIVAWNCQIDAETAFRHGVPSIAAGALAVLFAVSCCVGSIRESHLVKFFKER